MPDSAYQSYFGKPAFHAYGKNNTNPTVGGHVYGNYLLSHNVNPEHGKNNPRYQQVYKSALAHGFVNGDRVPVLSRKRKDNLEITAEDLDYKMKMNPIMPPKFEDPTPADQYEDLPEDTYKFEKKPKRKNIEFHPQQEAQDQPEDEYEHMAEGAPDSVNLDADDEVEHIANSGRNGAQPVGNSPFFNSQSPTPEPGTAEYKKMMQQLVNNPEYVKWAIKNGGDMESKFSYPY